jgi:hypothetical protein
VFKSIFRGLSDFFTNIFGGGKSSDSGVQAQPDPNQVAQQRDAEAKAAEEKQKAALSAQTGRGRLLNPFTGALGVGNTYETPFKSLF